MANSSVTISTTGDKLQTHENDLGSGPVHSEAVTPTDPTGTPFSESNPQFVSAILPTESSAVEVNSEIQTSSPLWTGDTWTGLGEQNDYGHVGVNLQTDEAGVLFFDFSLDGTNYTTFPVDGFTVAAGINEIHTAVKLGRWFRPRFVGEGGMTYFRLTTFYSSVPIELNSPLNFPMSPDTDGKVVKSAHQVQYSPRVSEVPDGWFDTPSLTKLRELRTRDQRAVDIENCNDAAQLTVFGDDTANLADTQDHVFGAGAITFDKVNGADNTVFAGVSRFLAEPINIGEIFEDGGFVACGVKLPSINNVSYVFVRLGTDASNYNEWRWSVDALNSGEWLQLRRATAQPSAFAGNGWDDDNVAWCSFGVVFDAQSNTLAGITFDNVHLVQGRISDTTILASIDSSVSGNKIDVTKVGGSAIDKNLGSASAGTQRVVLASDQPDVPTADVRDPYRGTSTPYGGTAGTVSVPDGHRLVSWMVHSTTGGSVAFQGVTIPVPANSFMSDSYQGFVGPFTITFTSTDSYHVVTNG